MYFPDNILHSNLVNFMHIMAWEKKIAEYRRKSRSVFANFPQIHGVIVHLLRTVLSPSACRPLAGMDAHTNVQCTHMNIHSVLGGYRRVVNRVLWPCDYYSYKIFITPFITVPALPYNNINKVNEFYSIYILKKIVKGQNFRLFVDLLFGGC